MQAETYNQHLFYFVFHSWYRIHTYEHEGEWGKALAAYDLQMQSSSSEATQLGLLKVHSIFEKYENLTFLYVER